MANTFIKVGAIARAALAHLYNETVFLPLMYRDFDEAFGPGVGDTVTVRKPASFTAQAYNGSTITVQNATESSTTVVLDKHIDVSFAVTSKDMTLNIVDFSAQLLAPAMEAHAQGVDRAIIAAFDAASLDTIGGPTDDSEPWNDPKVLIDARTALSTAKVPMTDRYVVASSRMAGEWLKDPLFNRVDQSGETAGLREASLGSRKFGFDPYESNQITTNAGYAFHRTAMAFVTRPLALPQGAAEAEIVSYKGLGLRVVKAYDMQLKSDIISIDILYGLKYMGDDRAVLIDGTASS